MDFKVNYFFIRNLVKSIDQYYLLFLKYNFIRVPTVFLFSMMQIVDLNVPLLEDGMTWKKISIKRQKI